ncbi:IS256 family transposase [Streptomyces sp. NBC_01231]|nr:IS256 family transposase [Streptomyces sp. NBC_01231]
MDERLAAEAGRIGGRGSRSVGNMRNGYRAKKVMTEVGAVTVQVPRDRLGTFRPRLLPVHARRTGALDDLVLSLTAKGLTSGEIVSHLAQTYGMTTTKETISTITDKALESMAEWRTRPLDPVYPVVFIDAVHVKIRDGHVANRPVYVAVAVTADGYREILGLWAGNGGEGAKYWQTVLTEIKNRGVRDVLMLVCDGLSALPDAVNTVWPQTVVQTCVVHLIRASLRYASRRDWAEVARDLKPVYTAVNEDEARQRLADFDATWGKRYPSIAGTWQRAWSEFVPFLGLPDAIRQVVYTTNAIESLNARYRRAAQACGHFPNEQAALKRLYLATLALDPTGRGRQRWNNRWKAALNEFDVLFDGRLTAGRV